MFAMMFEDFCNRSDFTDFTITFMPGMTKDFLSTKRVKCIINVDSKTVFAYID